MKWLFLSLLATNVLLLTWNWQGRGETVENSGMDKRGPIGGGAGQLVLLSEVEAPSASRPEEMVTPPVPTPGAMNPGIPGSRVKEEVADTDGGDRRDEAPKSAMRCLRLSGLESKGVAAAVAKALGSAGNEVRVLGQGDEVEEHKRYRVLLPAYPTETAAQKVLERLRRGGVQDVYFIRSGEHRNAISLGVFSNKESAQRRIRELGQLRLVPRIDEIVTPVTRWWVEFSWPAAQDRSGWRVRLPKELRSVVSRDCR